VDSNAHVLARIAGIVLILIGILGLAWGEIPYAEERHSAELGPIAVQTIERKTLPVPTIVAVTALVSGAVTLALGFGRPPGRSST
jgi:hypothetical protein